MNNRVCTKTAFCLFFVSDIFLSGHMTQLSLVLQTIFYTCLFAFFSSNPLSNNRVYSCHIFGEILLYVMFVKMFCSKKFQTL